MKRIILTGGGTAGHVTPNLALIPYLREAGCEITYIGSYGGIEKELIEKAGVEYYGIASGKLRRYLSLKNISDPLRVLKGGVEAGKIIREKNPDVVFSKGGYVSVPVVLAAERMRIPVVIHESDLTIGLANRLVMNRATKICCNFPETMAQIPGSKGILTGSPIREELKKGEKEKGIEICSFDASDTRSRTILVMCGSLGSVKINQNVREIIDRLKENYRVIHVCGRGNVDENIPNDRQYRQFEYVSDELPHLMALADMVVSRAGANSIAEFAMLAKPNLLIPLSKGASRGDQILNADSYRKQGFSLVLPEEEMTPDSLFDSIVQLDREKQKYIYAMQRSGAGDATQTVLEIIRKAADNKSKKRG